ncbi:MAG TPA: hypothetical protein H9754_01525 [Candidatus Anaerostipes avistercoris]|uniref:Uncharacterized protein n=1 Tax=Candidatus Anaerostipes avistercoris TaxID=2838462 RepID=A0A9D2PFT1_9FIRM|nr:hypothetical protein [Candidatus Anaerostipes avistercoris]
MLQNYIHTISVTLMGLNVGIDAPLAELIAAISVYAVVLYVITGIITVLARLTKQIRIVNSAGTKAGCAGCTLFILFSILSLYLMREYFSQILIIFHPQTISLMIQDPGIALRLLPLLVILVIVLIILFSVLFFCFSMCRELVSVNVKANGNVKGLFLSFYELLSGIGWLAVIICAFSIGMAIIFLPFLFAVCLSRRDKWYYEERRY